MVGAGDIATVAQWLALRLWNIKCESSLGEEMVNKTRTSDVNIIIIKGGNGEQHLKYTECFT